MNNPFEVIDARLANIETLLLDIKHGRNLQSTEPDRWFDIKQLCAYHPDHPTERTVYRLYRERKIPGHKDEEGKRLRFLKSEIDEYLKQGRRKTISEIAAEADKYIANKKARI